MKKLILFIICSLATAGFVAAQSKFPELEKIKQIKLLESTSDDVKKIFGDDNNISTENFYITFSYSGGKCSEDEDEDWNIAEGKVTEINVSIKDTELFKDAKIDLSKLEKIDMFERDETEDEPEDADAEPEDDQDEYIYYDQEKGISYSLSDGEISSIKFTPPEKNAPALCNNANFRELSSSKEWFINQIRRRPPTSEPRSIANVVELILSTEEVTADCPAENEAPSEYTKIAVEMKVESNNPGDLLTYNYTVSGGKLIGRGANIVWNLSGVKAGKYTITAAVDDGCGLCGTTKTKEVVVRTNQGCQQKPKKK